MNNFRLEGLWKFTVFWTALEVRAPGAVNVLNYRLELPSLRNNLTWTSDLGQDWKIQWDPAYPAALWVHIGRARLLICMHKCCSCLHKPSNQATSPPGTHHSKRTLGCTFETKQNPQTFQISFHLCHHLQYHEGEKFFSKMEKAKRSFFLSGAHFTNILLFSICFLLILWTMVMLILL